MGQHHGSLASMKSNSDSVGLCVVLAAVLKCLKMYNNLVERCFRECVEDMRSKAMSSKEEQCVAKCCEKYMNVTGRVGMRFSEFFSQMEAAAQQQMAEMAKQQASK
ncbi:hypothetical protein QJQ45_020552 [Haematococcus lacustris]|nr:hypothetical protein QJQ45_020552 [Haematococcus lacustris]